MPNYCMTYSPLIPFSVIINISLFANNSNFTHVFFKQDFLNHDNPGAEKSEQDQVHIFQYIYF